MAAGPHRLLTDGVANHESVVVNGRMFIWAGNRPDTPHVHNSKKKLNWSSSIDIFDISSRQWSNESTTGQPPLGIYAYSCTAINDQIYYFGGHCGHKDCYHNSLAALDTSNKRWKILSGTDDEIPVMRRAYGGLISVNDDNLLSIGGVGLFLPEFSHYRDPESYTEYSYDIRTNEMNLFSLSRRKWSMPSSIGPRMPPACQFTIEKISESQAIIFGGETDQEYSNVLYIIQIVIDKGLATVHWKTINRPMVFDEWPKKRWGHVSTIINQTVLVVVGGLGIGDDDWCWLYNISEQSWTKIDMSGHIEGRYHHSLSLMSGDNNCALLIFSGGRDSNSRDMLTLEDFYRVIKLRMTNDDKWTVDDGNKGLQAPEKVQFNIEHVDVEQVFEKPQHGIKLVIPPSSVPDHQSIDIAIQPVPTDTFTLPPDVEPVSCFYEFVTSGSFTKPIQLHIQHNVHLTFAEDTSRLAFVIGNGLPPGIFELCKDQQQFAPHDNAGVISVSHFSTHIFGIVWKVIDKIFPPKVYTIYPFYKQMGTTCWHVKIFITENQLIFLEMLKSNNLLNNWLEINPKAFKFKSNAIALHEANQTFDIKALPLEVIFKDEVDLQCQPNSSAFPHMDVKVKLKKDCTLSNLKFEFKGTDKESFFMISEVELSTKSSVNVMPKSVELLNDSELLDKEPKKSHLMTILNSVRYQWKEIGEQLEINNGNIMSLCYDSGLSDTGKLSEVLQLWIDGKTTTGDGSWKVSWRKILDVVKTPPIGNKVHDEMVEFLSRPDIQQQYLPCAVDYIKTTFSGLPMIVTEDPPADSPVDSPPRSPSPENKCCRIC